MKRKYLILGSTLILALASITGCGRKPTDAEDPTKAQLTIFNFDGGVGENWLKEAADRFTELMQDRDDFQDGRIGVQIHIKTDRSGNGSVIKTDGVDLIQDMYFTENVDYYMMSNQNKLADITDILTTPNPDDGNKKIIDKIDSNLLNFMNRNDKYYAIPFYDCIYGLVYDKDLFLEKAFYMKDDGGFTNNPAQFGTGPNGVRGDWDDGLPKTYEQFQNMMTKMKAQQVIPFIYASDESKYYTTRALTTWWSDDEGYYDTNLNYNFNGMAHNIVTTIDDEGIAHTTNIEINQNNGYVLRSQAGVYNALYFARNILTNDSSNYTSRAGNYDVQSAFVNSKNLGGSNKPIAMMFEGTWWENEAEPAFDEARSYGVDSFNYGVMPIPKANSDKIGDATFLNLNDSYCFINANTEHMKLAKEFLTYLHTDESLRAFTKSTNMTRGLKYSFDEADLSTLTSYARDLVAIKQSEHAKTVYPSCGLDFFVNNSQTFDVTNWVWNTKTLTSDPIIKFMDDKTLTAKEFFEQHVAAMGQSDWDRIING